MPDVPAGSNVVKGQGTNTLTFTLPGTPQYAIESVIATVDNGAGADTGAVLTMKDTDGTVIAKKRQGQEIDAGATTTATWALRLTDETTPSGGFTPLTEGFTNNNATGDSVAAGGSASLTWKKNGGDTLLDLTNPLIPTVIDAGTYAISTSVIIDPSTVGLLSGRTIFGQLATTGFSSFLPFSVENTVTWSTTGPAAAAIGLAWIRTWEAGEGLKYNVVNDQPVAIDCRLKALVVRLA